jgi:hypothetical protein
VSSVTLFNSPARGIDAAADETAHKASQDFHPDGRALLVQDAFRRETFEWTQLPGDGWFWAFEWNKSVRVAGSIAHPGIEPRIFESLPEAGTVPLPDGRGLYRLEVPLALMLLRP